jgi:hypothetical protein
VPRSLVDFFEASPYGVLANGGEGVKTHSINVCALSRVGRSPSFLRKVAQMQKKIPKSIEIAS